MRRSILPFVAVAPMVGLAGCANQWARHLGGMPVSFIQTGEHPLSSKGIAVHLEVEEEGNDAQTGGGEATAVGTKAKGSVKAPIILIYTVDDAGRTVTDPSTSNGVYRVADVTHVIESPCLGLPTSDLAANCNKGSDALLARRRMLALTLLSVADDNGAEFWRRFSAMMTYRKAARDTGKAFMGSSIAGTFISPVLGASLAGAGLAFDTFTDVLTSEFDIEMYTALREAVRAEVLVRRTALFKRLQESPYREYPASAVITDVSDYAYVYSIRGAVDALKKATRIAGEQAEAEAKKPKDGT